MPLSDDRQIASRLNRLVDLGLEGRHLPVLLLLRVTGAPRKLAERIRRRAARLVRLAPACSQTTLAQRESLIRAVYARAAGTDRVAWCDASWQPGSNGIGAAALVCDHRGHIQQSVQKHSPAELDAVEAEALAVTLAVESALALSGGSLTAYSDCAALVQLWRKKRQDPRLRQLRQAAASLRFFRLRLIQRSHNQSAHRLAREALCSSGSDSELR